MNSEPYDRSRRGASGRLTSGSALPGLLALSPPAAAFVFGPSLLSAASPGLVVGIVLALVLIIAVNGLCVAGETAIDLLKASHEKAVEGESEQRQANLRDMLGRKPSFVAACSLGAMTMRAWMVGLTVVPAVPVSEWLRLQVPALESAVAGSVLIAVLALAIPVVAANVVFGELIPKSYATAHPVQTSLRLYGPVKFFNGVFSAPIRAFVSIAGLVTKRFGAIATFAVANPTEEEIKELLEEAEESEMVALVFEFGDTVVREVMTPRVDLSAVPVGSSLSEIAEIVEQTGFSRIPVYEGSEDSILGIVHAKDVLSAIVHGRADTPVRELMRPAVFVPESKDLHDLLQEMRQGKTQMVIVQDDYSGTAGIVTIEDIVEEVMGEIVDEYDEDLPEIVAQAGGFLSDGKMELDDVNEAIGSGLESEEFDTVGGFVFGLFGRQPKEGEKVESDGFRFIVAETDKKRILKIRIERLASPARTGSEELGAQK